MASSFHHIFKFDNTSLSYCDIADTNTDDCETAGGDIVSGGADDDFGICPTASGEKNYSKTFIIPSQAKDFAFCSVCSVCSCKMTIEMSPDGVNWCDCLDSAQKECKDIVCTFTEGGSACTCKVVNAPMMQYVRVALHDGAAPGGKCKVSIHWTTF